MQYNSQPRFPGTHTMQQNSQSRLCNADDKESAYGAICAILHHRTRRAGNETRRGRSHCFQLHVLRALALSYSRGVFAAGILYVTSAMFLSSRTHVVSDIR